MTDKFNKLPGGVVEQHPSETISYPIETSVHGPSAPTGVTLRAYDMSDWTSYTLSTFTSSVDGTGIAVAVGGGANNDNVRIEVEYTKGSDVILDYFTIEFRDNRG